MNIKKKLIAFIVTFVAVLCLTPTIWGQAATTDVENSSNSGQSSNAAPNPGTPENKPAALNVSNVIPVNNPQSITKTGDSKPNLTSTIGWKNENGAWYYYKSDNTKAIGWIKPDSNWYYLKGDGKMATGWLYDSNWYYLDNSGAMVTGWKQVNNQWYFLTSSGAMATGIQFDGTSLYYLTDSGAMYANGGWIKVNNKWYYADKSGRIETGWIKDNNSWYFLQGDGSMVTGLYNINNKTYMFYDNGSMVIGWIYENGYWYYFNDSGVMETGWITTSGKSYYLYDTGAMAKGWLNLNGTWYYLNNNGSMATGWVTSNGSDYYLDTSTGRMLTDTTIDGYKIGVDGKRYGTSSLNTSTSTSSGNASSTYYGIDISNYDGYVDFNSVKSSGVQLVYIKATEGTTFVDPYLQINYSGASAAGLKVGFYHFLVGTSAPETQADNFYNNIKDKKNDLIPMLDVESTGFDVMDYTLRFIAEFKKVSNMNIGIYTYSNFMSNLDGRLSSYPLWEANYNNTPFNNLPTNSIWFSRIGHQYSDTGFITGINANVDLDEFKQGIFS